MRRILLIITTYCLFLTAFAEYDDTLYASISAAQAYDTVQFYEDSSCFIVIDIRTPGEFNSSHIDGAININFYDADFQAQLDKLNKYKVYLIHCASGGRSGSAFSVFQGLNFRVVYNMLGGFNSWLASGYPATTITAPKLSILCTNEYLLSPFGIGDTDTLDFSIANHGNYLLSLSGVEGFDNSEFETNFNSDTQIVPGDDYNFKIYYTASDLGRDTLTMNIISDGGSLEAQLVGSLLTTSEHEIEELAIRMYVNQQEKTLMIENASSRVKQLLLFDVEGRLVMSSTIDNSSISLSQLKQGVYYILPIGSERFKGKKIVVL